MLIPTRPASRLRLLLLRTALGMALALPGLTCGTATHSASAQGTEANITRLTASILARSQFAHHPLDKELAAKFLDRYLDALDGNRSLFLQTDVQQFGGSQPTLVHAIVLAGDTQLSQVIWKRYLERLEQRSQYVAQLLAKPDFKFEGQDTFQIDRDDAPRPADLAGAQALWRERVRAEYLDEKLNDTPADQIREKLLRRHQQQLTSMRSLSTEEVTDIYLNALASVYDPHSEYLGREQMQNLEMAMNLSLFGIGASLESVDGYCTVREILPGSPASRSTLKPGDRIVAVAQADKPAVDITNMPLTRAVQLIRGPKGTRVTLTLLPAASSQGAGSTQLTLVRAEVQLEDQQVKASIVDLPDGKDSLRLGVIDLPSFYAALDGGDKRGHARSVTEDVQRLLVKLKAAKVRGIVLDLRRNGGGSLEEAIRLTGLFIPKGPVVQTRGPSGDVEIAEDTDPTEQYTGPLVVLVSRMSASASEILAGALQDYGRALVVGDTATFGKGTVQSIMPLAPIMRENDLPFSHDPGALKITIRKFYRPSGASTQLRGVSSDIVIPSNTDVSEISEAAQKDPLPWDTVKAARYEPRGNLRPFLEVLRKQSAERVAKEQPFTYVKETLAQARERLAIKRASLNEAQRRKELARDKARQHELATFWEARRSSAPKSYPIRLKDAASPGLPPAVPFVALDAHDLERLSKGPDGKPEDSALASAAASDLVLTEALQILVDYMRAASAPKPS